MSTCRGSHADAFFASRDPAHFAAFRARVSAARANLAKALDSDPNRSPSLHALLIALDWGGAFFRPGAST